jgi:hypothetical protein
MDHSTSQEISDFLKFLSQATSDYSFSKEEVGRLDLLSQDYLHKLELQEGNYHDRAKVANALRQCRIDRRFHKDRVSILEPLVQCLEADRGKLIVSQLQQVLGAVRKEERATKDRHYVPRILSREEYEGITKNDTVERA